MKITWEIVQIHVLNQHNPEFGWILLHKIFEISIWTLDVYIYPPGLQIICFCCRNLETRVLYLVQIINSLPITRVKQPLEALRLINRLTFARHSHRARLRTRWDMSTIISLSGEIHYISCIISPPLRSRYIQTYVLMFIRTHFLLVIWLFWF